MANGKLNILGGGFSRIGYINPTLDFSVAGKIYIPWNETNQPKGFRLFLLDQDGKQVTQTEGKVKVEISTPIEVGRPAGIAQGTELDFPFAFRFNNLELIQGRYTWRLEVDNFFVTDVIFYVLNNPQKIG